MIHYLIRRVLVFIPMLLAISVIAFIIIQLPPGSFIEQKMAELQMAGGEANAMVQMDALKKRYGLDRPLAVQYLMWIKGIVTRGDFGESFAFNRDVNELIWTYIGHTLLLSGASFLFVYLLAIPLGAYAATKQYKWQDNLISALSFVGMSLPEFLLALVLLVGGIFWLNVALIGLFSPGFEFQPWSWAKFMDLLKHLPIPALIVAVNGTAGIMRIMRGNMVEVLAQPYMRTARAKGLPRATIIGRHGLRMAINPLISIMGMSLPGLLSGSAIISIVLNLPTAGLLLYDALKLQDMYLAGSLILVMSFVLLVGNLLADVLLVWADPRIRYD